MKTFTSLFVCAVLTGVTQAAAPNGNPPLAIPTFHCLGLYWSPPGGAADKPALVRYRQRGAATWKEGLPMRYHPIPNTEEDLADYRGSIVNLAPGTAYEIQLTLSGTQTMANFTATTWSVSFPVGETVRVGNRDTPLVITNSVNTRPLTVGLAIFGAPESGVDWAVISAGTLMAVSPLLVAFLLFQRQFMQSFMQAGIK